MELWYDINIDQNKEVIFPEYCPVCGEKTKNTFLFKADPDGYYGYFKWLFGLTKKYNVPCHSNCYRKVKLPSILRNISLILLITALIPVALYFELSRWKAILVLIVIMSPIILWQMKNPLPLEIMQQGDFMNFAVRDKDYATDLAKLNRTTVE